MIIKDWGEQGILTFISQNFLSPPHIQGIGDDCSVIPMEKNQNLLVTVDALVEGIHFLSSVTPEDLGYKTVMVNVSDIAAMGGKAEYLFLSLSLPSTLSDKWVKRFFKGFKEACTETKVHLLGGDTVGSLGPISISLTALGFVSKNSTKYRSQAREDDLICVTGQLGASGAGFKLLSADNFTIDDITKPLIQAHTRPKAHFQEGFWLGQHKAVHAMMDISDGLGLDVPRLLQASRCGGVINIEDLPLHPSLQRLEKEKNFDTLDLALFGGEEYLLLLTVCPEAFEKLNNQYEQHFQKLLYPIGHITRDQGLQYQAKGEKISIPQRGFSHF